MFRKLFKKVQFLKFCADLSQKLKSVKAIYIYSSESSYYSLSENDVIIEVWATIQKILAIKISKKDAYSLSYNIINNPIF